MFSFSWTPFCWGRKRYAGIGRHISCYTFPWTPHWYAHEGILYGHLVFSLSWTPFSCMFSTTGCTGRQDCYTPSYFTIFFPSLSIFLSSSSYFITFLFVSPSCISHWSVLFLLFLSILKSSSSYFSSPLYFSPLPFSLSSPFVHSDTSFLFLFLS